MRAKVRGKRKHRLPKQAKTGDGNIDRELRLVNALLERYQNEAPIYMPDVNDVPAFTYAGDHMECRVWLKQRKGTDEWWRCTASAQDVRVHANGDTPHEALRHAVIEMSRKMTERG